jgi:hypothetical protein
VIVTVVADVNGCAEIGILDVGRWTSATGAFDFVVGLWRTFDIDFCGTGGV